MEERMNLGNYHDISFGLIHWLADCGHAVFRPVCDCGWTDVDAQSHEDREAALFLSLHLAQKHNTLVCFDCGSAYRQNDIGVAFPTPLANPEI